MFCYDLASIMLAHRTEKFMCKLIQCDICMIKYVMSI